MSTTLVAYYMKNKKHNWVHIAFVWLLLWEILAYSACSLRKWCSVSQFLKCNASLVWGCVSMVCVYDYETGVVLNVDLILSSICSIICSIMKENWSEIDISEFLAKCWTGYCWHDWGNCLPACLPASLPVCLPACGPCMHSCLSWR